MYLTESHIIKDDRFKKYCELSKELYNQSLYYWRQSVFGNIQYFNEFELIKLFREFNDELFRSLPSHTSQDIIRGLFNSINSWRSALKEFKKNPSKFHNIKPKLPKYKKKLGVLPFNNLQVKIKNGYVHFPKILGLNPIKTNINNIKYCRVIPKSNHFLVLFVYEIPDVKEYTYNGNALGVDLGINNLLACVSNKSNSFIITGKPLKSINAFFNKKKAKLQSSLKPNKFTSKRIFNLTKKRNNKVKDFLHKSSSKIIKECESNNITKIVIGHNKGWKRELNLGRRINQNFSYIPHSNLIKLIEYKAKKVGISVVITEESYTSKCSSVDLEPITKHSSYVGNRKKRGLFVTANGVKINADCNGAANILRKVIGDFKINDSILSSMVTPVKM